MPKYRRSRLFFLLIVLVVCLPAKAPAEPPGSGDDCRIVELDYDIVDKNNIGKKLGLVNLRITRAKDYHRWLEFRRYPDGGTDTFDVAYAPSTLQLLFYERRLTDKKGTRIIRLDRNEDLLRAVVTGYDGRARNLDIDISNGPVVVEPLMKSHLEQALVSGAEQGEFTLVLFLFDKLRKVSVDWQFKGQEIISVPFGQVTCSRLLVSASAWLLKLVDAGADLWLDADGYHDIVQSPIRKDLLAEENRMVLRQRQVIACP